jgi:IS605 OrfB family transposase
MKAIRTIKLKITSSNNKLHEVGIAYRNAANWLSSIIYNRNIVQTPASLSNEFYATVREKFNLPSQVTCSLFRQVVGTYRAMKSNKEWELAIFKKINVPICWKRDFNVSKKGLTIWGDKVAYKSKPIPQGEWSDSKLKLIGKTWFLILTVQVDIPDQKETGTIVGVDSGIKNLFVAVEPKSGKTLFIRSGSFNHRRACIRRTRAKVASVGTPSAKRLLKRLKGREAAVTQDFLHVASKRLVAFAESVDARCIVMENLQGIREHSLECGKKHRSRVHRWPYAQGQFFVEYKAANQGIGYEVVPPKNTSRGCPKCGHTEKANRNGLVFRCKSCNYQDNADRVGGLNCSLRSILHRQADGERAMYQLAYSDDLMDQSQAPPL